MLIATWSNIFHRLPFALLLFSTLLLPRLSPAQPSLTIAATNGTPSVSWPAAASGWGWYPQQTTRLARTANTWTDAPVTTATNGASLSFTDAPSGSQRFYRLSDKASVLLNVYSLTLHTEVQTAITQLAPYVRTNDVFVLVSGNNSGPADLVSLNYWTTNLHAQFPANELWLLTSGLTNVAFVASNRAQLPAWLTTIVYDYEPGWTNEPEFSWDFTLTVSNYTVAATLAHAGGFALAGAPTGRPILESDLLQYHWDYGALRTRSGADGMIIQTQTWCKSGTDVFQQALNQLKTQETAANSLLNLAYPQITVDTNSGNGIPPAPALACARAARLTGFPRVSLWFAPPRYDAAVAFLKGRP